MCLIKQAMSCSYQKFTMSYISIFFIILLSRSSVTMSESCSSYPTNYTQFNNGKTVNASNLLIVGMFPMFSKDGYINLEEITLSEALLYNTKELQKQVYFVNIGIVLYDTSCQSNLVTSQLLDVILNNSTFKDFEDYKILSILVSGNNMQMKEASNILKADSIPLLDFTKGPAAAEFSTFKRNYDSGRMEHITFLLTTISLSYVTLIVDDTIDGKIARVTFEGYLRENNICIAQEYYLPTTTNHLDIFAQHMSLDSKMETVIIWSVQPKAITRFLRHMHNRGIKNRIYITSTDINMTEIPKHMVEDNILVLYISDLLKKGDSKFKNMNLTFYENPWLKYYIETTGNNSLKTLPENNLDDFNKIMKFVMNPILYEEILEYDYQYTINKKMHRILPLIVYDIVRRLKRQVLSKQYTFRIMTIKNNARKLETIKLEHFKSHKLICDKPCSLGFGPFYFNNKVSCCWQCVKCTAGYYKNETEAVHCAKCPENMSSNKNRSICKPFVGIYVTPSNSERLFVYTFGSIATLLCLCTLIIFFKFRNTPVVRASDAEKTLVQLLSHGMLSLTLFLFSFRQTQLICSFQPVLVGFFMTITSSITFIKTKRLLLIFEAKTRISHHHITKTKVIAISTMVFLLLIQIFISFVSYMFYPHRHTNTRDYNEIKEFLKCNNQIYFTIQFVYVKMVSALCLWQAYKARKLPENFNETKYIGIAVLVSEIFLLAYIAKPETDVVTNIVLLFCSNLSLTVIMYGYRVYIILFRPGRNDAKVFHNQLMKKIKQDVATRTTTFMTTDAGNDQ